MKYVKLSYQQTSSWKSIGRLFSVHFVARYKCDHCEYESTTKAALRSHEKQHLNDEDKLKCDFCSFRTPHKENLQKHTKNSHTGKSKTMNCSLCNFVAQSLRDYQNHLASIHKGNLLCEYCDFKTHSIKCLKEHIERCGPNVTLHYCYKCDYKTSQKIHLGTHLNKVHGKNTKCDKCDYTTTQNGYMRKHEKICYDLKQYSHKCPNCDYRTFAKVDLRKHLLRICNSNWGTYLQLNK